MLHYTRQCTAIHTRTHTLRQPLGLDPPARSKKRSPRQHDTAVDKRYINGDTNTQTLVLSHIESKMGAGGEGKGACASWQRVDGKCRCFRYRIRGGNKKCVSFQERYWHTRVDGSRIAPSKFRQLQEWHTEMKSIIQ